MYARFVLIPPSPGARSRERLERRANDVTSRLKQLGFTSILLLRDEHSGEVGALSLWESKEALEAAAPTLDRMARAGVTVTGTPTVRLFEVYQ